MSKDNTIAQQDRDPALRPSHARCLGWRGHVGAREQGGWRSGLSGAARHGL